MVPSERAGALERLLRDGAGSGAASLGCSWAAPAGLLLLGGGWDAGTGCSSPPHLWLSSQWHLLPFSDLCLAGWLHAGEHSCLSVWMLRAFGTGSEAFPAAGQLSACHLTLV